VTTPTMEPIHPGEVLMLEHLEPLGITQHRVAVAIGVPPRRINEIVHGKRGITADTALRLARYFGTSERFWLNLQSRYEIEVERDRLADNDALQPVELRAGRGGPCPGGPDRRRQIGEGRDGVGDVPRRG
jgi:antitoxin HigA-1